MARRAENSARRNKKNVAALNPLFFGALFFALAPANTESLEEANMISITSILVNEQSHILNVY